MAQWGREEWRGGARSRRRRESRGRGRAGCPPRRRRRPVPPVRGGAKLLPRDRLAELPRLARGGGRGNGRSPPPRSGPSTCGAVAGGGGCSETTPTHHHPGGGGGGCGHPPSTPTGGEEGCPGSRWGWQRRCRPSSLSHPALLGASGAESCWEALANWGGGEGGEGLKLLPAL